MSNTPAFIEKLLLRLKSGDARSIHLNALPGNFARLDIYDLANIEPSLHLRFLQQLLTSNSFRFSITIDAEAFKDISDDNASADKKKMLQKIIKRLNHLDYQEKQEYSEHGYHSFGFGYPLLIKRDPDNPDRIIKAPLLIWYLDIEKDQRRNNTWIISRKEEHPLIFNELLRSHLESNEKISTKALEDFLEEDFMDERRLLIFCKKILEQLNVSFDDIETIATLLPSTNKESIELLTKASPWIRWGGIFGLYKMQKQPLIKDLSLLLHQKDNPVLKEETIHTHTELLTPVVLDPSQENVLQQLTQYPKVLIQGPPGTGKSQTLTAVITHALLNQQKVLVVCEKRTAMEVLYNNLRQHELHHFCGMIEDVYVDRKNIVEHVRNTIEEKEQVVQRFRTIEFEELKKRFLFLKNQLNHHINFTDKQIFGDDNWIELLAKSYRLNQDKNCLDKANALNKILLNSSYVFSYEEYVDLLEKVTVAQALFAKVSQNAFVFDALHTNVFEQSIPAKDLFSVISRVYEGSDALLESIGAFIKRDGKAYNLLQGSYYHWYSLLSLLPFKYNGIRKQQQQDLAATSVLNKEVLERAYFSVDALPVLPKNMEYLLPALKSLKAQTAQFLEQENAFPDYADFKKYYLQQDEKTKALIKALMPLATTVWKEVFSAYYLNQIIIKTAIEHNLKDNIQYLFDELVSVDYQLKERVASKIQVDVQENIRKVIEGKDLTTLKYLYNQRKNKQFSAKNSLRHILHQDFEFFSAVFPVLMVNPVVAASILPLQQELYDLIILDEASQLRMEDTYSSLIRAKRIVVSGDKHQMPPSNFFGNEVIFWSKEDEEINTDDFLAESKSLLEYAEDASFKSSYLDYHYRSQHPDLIQFSNHAFYQSRLIPLPAKKQYAALHYQHVDGIYMDGRNMEEATAVVRYIYSIQPIDGLYPSVGIATFNIHQRDLIYDLLYEAAYSDTVKAEQLQGLLSKGLFVKNLENIQGDERDIMLLSTTFGKDETGKFRQQFGPLTQEKGYQLLNVIVTRAKKVLHLFTSIPESVFMNFEGELSAKGNIGKGIFYAYLNYVKACSEGNEVQLNFVKEQLAKNSKLPLVNKPKVNTFKALVLESLKERFADSVVSNYILGGLDLDIVLLKENRPLLYISFEDPQQRYDASIIYRLKLYQQHLVAQYGIHTYHLWSLSWWGNAEAELDRIAEQYSVVL